MTKNKKNYKRKHLGIEGKKEEEQDLVIPNYINYIVCILILAIFTLSLYLRTVMPYDSVFRNGVVAFASDDAVFHMRLVENTLYNFPHRIIFDAMTKFPFGNILHFGHFFTQLIASISLIAGIGSYNMQTVNTIGAFMPAVLGALVVFPVYIIGKSLGGRSGGLLAAFMIAVLPGQFFSRSTLGFTDHHVAEVFFSTATIAFFILALKAGRELNIKFSDVRLKVKPVIYSLFAGVMLAAFQLSWAGAPFFSMIISIFILIQYIIDDMRGRSTDYLAIAAVPMFLVNFIFVLPYVIPEYGFASFIYSWFHVAVALAGMGLPISLSLISRELKKRGYKPYHYPVFLGGFFILSMLIMSVAMPQLYGTIVYTPNIIFQKHTGGSNTVAEATPTFDRLGYFYNNFPILGSTLNVNCDLSQFADTCRAHDNYLLWFVIIVLLAISYSIVRKQTPEKILFLVWSIVMLLAVIGQNRWAYYFAVNTALLVGYAGGGICDAVLKWGGWKWQIDTEKIGISHILSLAIAVFLVIFFTFPSAVTTAIGEQPISKWGGGEPSGGGFSEWLETLTWMRYNTPDPGVDYFAIYDQPKNGTYPYPDTAYGVIDWWDYGHIITYWGHRIPNANPFQAGIGGGTEHRPGATTFLTAKTEEQASDVLNALGINGKPGARYVVSNAYMAYQIMSTMAVWNEEYDYWTQIRTRDGMQNVPSMKYYEVMEAKLHIFDGNGLRRYRLVHESSRNPYNDEPYFKNVYNLLYGGNIQVENSGMVKVFEFVKGANITGRVPPNTQVTLTTTIKTNIGRTFQYSQTTTASNGTYVFTVPYSTKGPIAGETNFDTQPEGQYTVTAGNVTKQVDVGERDVLDGGIVALDLITGK